MEHSIKSLFSNIQNELIGAIEKAQKEILVAVAWFTNRDIFDCILSALKRGIKCQLILHDDLINRSIYNVDFTLFLEQKGELKFYSSEQGIMHNKFCVIDGNVLFMGSYNWTYAAEYRNNESIIVTNDTIVCNDFRSYFSKLWQQYPLTTEYNPVALRNIFDASYQLIQEDFKKECEIMVDKQILESAIVDKIKLINGLTSSLRNVNQPHAQNEKVVMKYDLGMRCRINGVDNRTLKIVKAGRAVPISQAFVKVTNIPDYPEEMSCELLLGNSDVADENITLCNLVNKQIPKMPAGKLDLRAIVDIDSSGCIKLSYKCENNGSIVTTSILAPDIVKSLY